MENSENLLWGLARKRISFIVIRRMEIVLKSEESMIEEGGKGEQEPNPSVIFRHLLAAVTLFLREI